MARGNSIDGPQIDSEGHQHPADALARADAAAEQSETGHDLDEGEGLAPTERLAVWPELEQFIGPGGKLEQALGGYERRAGQELMMRSVAHAFEHGETLVVEAGTGIGKSLGYLLPAALSGLRVILSTGTRTLQDQLARNQVPFLREGLKLPVEAAVLKGRTNYLCLLFLQSARLSPDIRLDEHADLTRIERWAESTTTGDRAELVDLPEASTAWRAVAADAERCLGRSCPLFSDCYLMAARRRAEAADLVIVNHHLFFADLGLREGARFSLLPDADAVVFDEAHHLESIASNAFGRSISDARVRRLAIDTRRALVAASASLSRVEGPLAELERDRERLFALLTPLAGRGRLRPERLAPAFLDAVYKLDNTLISLGLSLEADAREALSMHAAPVKETGWRGASLAVTEGLRRLPGRLDELRRDLIELLTPDPGNSGDSARSGPQSGQGPEVRWIERGERATFVRAVPIDVGPRLDEALSGRFRSLVFTSATLRAQTGRAGSGFEHFFSRLGLPATTRALSLPSPFDYRRQALLYCPADLPDPRHPSYAALLHTRIGRLVGLTKGRALVLFTSRERMLEAHTALAPTWAHPTLLQGQGSKESLLARFMALEGAVLFATATFWEGVDVVGDALSLVIIEKLPFTPPNDPVVEARLERLERLGGDGFTDYQVPTAIVALKQGFGRLIRHRGDRGIVAILDPRLTTARYGRLFLESLPPARRVNDLVLLEQLWGELGGAGVPTA